MISRIIYFTLFLMIASATMQNYLGEREGSTSQFQRDKPTVYAGGRYTLNLGSNFTSLSARFPSASENFFIILQAHSQAKEILLSSSPQKTLTSVTGTNIGSLHFIKSNERNITFYARALIKSSETVFLASLYKSKDPIPGGCCITCTEETNPVLDISYDSLRTYIKLKRANIFNRKSPCDGKPYASFRLKYVLYVYFLREGNYGEVELFNALWKMSSSSNIEKYGTKVATSGSLNFETMTIETEGAVYNVIVKDGTEGTSSAYIPTVTYGCKFDPVKKKCIGIGSVLMLFYAFFGGLVGLVMCFVGLKLFKIQLFLSGLTTVWLVAFLCLSRQTELNLVDRMIISTAVGVLGGVALVSLWLKTQFVHLCLANNGILLGVLLAATIYYTKIGVDPMWHNELIFFLSFLCITFAVPIFFIFFPKALSIASSAIIGAFAVMVVISNFVHGTLVYIVKCFIWRMSKKGYSSVYMEKPFQSTDVILCCFWVLLAVTGMIVQYFTTRNVDFLEESRQGANWRSKYKKMKTFRRWRRRDPERKPLLEDNPSGGTYSAILPPAAGRSTPQSEPSTMDSPSAPLKRNAIV